MRTDVDGLAQRHIRSPVGGRALGSRPAGPRGPAVVGAARVCLQPPQRHDHQSRSPRHRVGQACAPRHRGALGRRRRVGFDRGGMRPPATRAPRHCGRAERGGCRPYHHECATTRRGRRGDLWHCARIPGWTCPIPIGSSWAAADSTSSMPHSPAFDQEASSSPPTPSWNGPAEAQKRLGNLVQISVARGVPTGGLGTRLSAENPVFICWGPELTGRPHAVPQSWRPSRIAEVIAPADSSVSGRYRAPMVSATWAANPKRAWPSSTSSTRAGRARWRTTAAVRRAVSSGSCPSGAHVARPSEMRMRNG